MNPSQDIRAGIAFLRTNGVAESLRRCLALDAHPLIQFIKYGLCGVLAVIFHNAIVIALGSTVLPCMDWIDGLTDSTRQRNLIYCNLAAFLPTNILVYQINRRWVFTPGRHTARAEYTLFTLVSAISFGAGLSGGPLLIKAFALPSSIAQLGFIITSALVNFVCRKLVIFKG